MKARGWNLTDLKQAAAAEDKDGNIARACHRSIDNAKAGKPVIKATIRAIARALGVDPAEKLVEGYNPVAEPVPPDRTITHREITVNGISPEMLEAFEDLLPLLNKLRDAIKGKDDMHGSDVKDGSLRITLELSARDAAALDAAFAGGQLHALGVVDVTAPSAAGTGISLDNYAVPSLHIGGSYSVPPPDTKGQSTKTIFVPIVNHGTIRIDGPAVPPSASHPHNPLPQPANLDSTTSHFNDWYRFLGIILTIVGPRVPLLIHQYILADRYDDLPALFGSDNWDKIARSAIAVIGPDYMSRVKSELQAVPQEKPSGQ